MNAPMKPRGLPPIPLFSGLPADALAALADQLERRRAKAGAILVEEGTIGSELFVLVRGTARVTRLIDGRRRQVDELRERSFFGEIALLADTPRVSTVEAATDVELLVLPRAALESLCRVHPAIGAALHNFFKARLLANVLRANPRFRSLSEPQRQAILDGIRVRSFEPGARLIRQGERGEAVHFLLRGRCEITHTTPDGLALRYGELREGDVFGEIALLLGTESTAEVRALDRGVVLTLSRAAFEQALLRNDALRAHVEDLRDSRIATTAAAFTAHDLPVDAVLLCA